MSDRIGDEEERSGSQPVGYGVFVLFAIEKD
jgi:hypothetical protein